MKLKLNGIPVSLRRLAIEEFERGDAIGFLCRASNEVGLDIVAANLIALLDRGIYEDALLPAFRGTRTNNLRMPLITISRLFALADRERLRECGCPLPDGESFKVYRGVAGEGAARRVNSFSWTLDRSVACWFALRYNLPSPAVYTANVKRNEVYAYTNEREEQEVICRPVRCRRLISSGQLLAARGDEVTLTDNSGLGQVIHCQLASCGT